MNVIALLEAAILLCLSSWYRRPDAERQDWSMSYPSRETRNAIATIVGAKSPNQWGDANGTLYYKGVRFYLAPKGSGVGRLRVECPACKKQIPMGIFGNDRRHLLKCYKKARK